MPCIFNWTSQIIYWTEKWHIGLTYYYDLLCVCYTSWKFYFFLLSHVAMMPTKDCGLPQTFFYNLNIFTNSSICLFARISSWNPEFYASCISWQKLMLYVLTNFLKKNFYDIWSRRIFMIWYKFVVCCIVLCWLYCLLFTGWFWCCGVHFCCSYVEFFLLYAPWPIASGLAFCSWTKSAVTAYVFFFLRISMLNIRSAPVTNSNKTKWFAIWSCGWYNLFIILQCESSICNACSTNTVSGDRTFVRITAEIGLVNSNSLLFILFTKMDGPIWMELRFLNDNTLSLLFTVGGFVNEYRMVSLLRGFVDDSSGLDTNVFNSHQTAWSSGLCTVRKQLGQFTLFVSFIGHTAIIWSADLHK